ncbi:MAG TPA: M50 family metallopeptidase [Gemmataceae bacterium]|nr:M50 family metallopeptidase [Gemmataceae bacterium]
MLRSWKIGRVFGIDIYIHWSFVILFFLAIWQYSPHGVAPTVLTLLLVPALLLFVLLHEYGHALTARMFGIGTRDITLYPLGGVARLEKMSEVPIEEIIISLAGPAVNLVLAILFGLSFLALGFDGTLLGDLKNGGPTSVPEYLFLLTIMNVGLLLFNLIPAFPMDGGRIFRAFLALFLPRIAATKVAVGVGMGFAVLFLLGAFSVNPVLLLIAVFVPLAGMMELAMLQRQAEMRRRMVFEHPYAAHDVAWALPADALPPAGPPEPNFSGYTWDHQLHAWVEWQNGAPVRSCRAHGL